MRTAFLELYLGTLQHRARVGVGEQYLLLGLSGTFGQQRSKPQVILVSVFGGMGHQVTHNVQGETRLAQLSIVSRPRFGSRVAPVGCRESRRDRNLTYVAPGDSVNSLLALRAYMRPSATVAKRSLPVAEDPVGHQSSEELAHKASATIASDYAGTVNIIHQHGISTAGLAQLVQFTIADVIQQMRRSKSKLMAHLRAAAAAGRSASGAQTNAATALAEMHDQLAKDVAHPVDAAQLLVQALADNHFKDSAREQLDECAARLGRLERFCRQAGFAKAQAACDKLAQLVRYYRAHVLRANVQVVVFGLEKVRAFV